MELKNSLSLSERVRGFLSKYTSKVEKNEVAFFAQKSSSNYHSIGNKRVLIDLNNLNRNQFISRHFRQVNEALDEGAMFIGCVQTHQQMRESRRINKIPVVKNLYNVIEFGVHRILPKLKYLGKGYKFFMRNGKRRLTKTEVLGRLVRYGFRIVEVEEDIDGKLFFAVEKNGAVKTDQKPSYGPLYKMPRIGKDGKLIHVYKFRTMHPYSEYLQDYILRNNGYAESGKPANDFRLTSWGKVMRKYWLDEIPQLINVVRGEMKIIGVRPVSHRYFEDIPAHIQSLRLKQKPGCIPPYVALNRASSKDSVLDAEETYLRLSKDRITRVDTGLVYLAFKNIVIKGKRSA
ncbi:MAG: sugar transferase [Flavobacteriales bacterium]|nr:sugar transferase [Flavobacteriales bacterium]